MKLMQIMALIVEGLVSSSPGAFGAYEAGFSGLAGFIPEIPRFLVVDAAPGFIKHDADALAVDVGQVRQRLLSVGGHVAEMGGWLALDTCGEHRKPGIPAG